MAKKKSASRSKTGGGAKIAGAAKKKAGGGRKKAAKRELIDTGNDKRFVRRDESGRFDEVDDVGRSLAQDRRQKAKHTVKAGQGDKGDQKRRSHG
jgi:hypothetical protein